MWSPFVFLVPSRSCLTLLLSPRFAAHDDANAAAAHDDDATTANDDPTAAHDVSAAAHDDGSPLRLPTTYHMLRRSRLLLAAAVLTFFVFQF